MEEQRNIALQQSYAKKSEQRLRPPQEKALRAKWAMVWLPALSAAWNRRVGVRRRLAEAWAGSPATWMFLCLGGLLLGGPTGVAQPWEAEPAWSYLAAPPPGTMAKVAIREDRPPSDSLWERSLLPQPEPYRRERYRYGAGGGLAEREVDDWVGQPPAWQPVAREVFLLRSDGQARVVQTYSPTQTGWFLRRIDSLTFAADGQLRERRRYRFPGPGAPALPYERERYERDAAGRVLRFFRDQWEGVWQPWVRITYAYGLAAPPLRSRTAFWEASQGQWQLAGGADFALSQGLIDTATYGLIDSLGQWQPDYRDVYRYDSLGQALFLQRERWQAAGWQAEEQRHWAYDFRGELLWQEVALAASPGWLPFRRYERVIRAGPLSRYRLGYWTGSAWSWERDVTFYYPLPVWADLPAVSWQLFPNPAREQVQVQGLPPDIFTYQLLDAQGRRLRQGKLRGPAATLSLSGLAAGQYWLRLQGVGGSHTWPLWCQP